MRFINCIVWFDLSLAAMGALSAWYLNRPFMYALCAQVAVGGILIKIVARAWSSVKSDLFKGK